MPESEWNGEYFSKDEKMYIVNDEIVNGNELKEVVETVYYDDDGEKFNSDEVECYESTYEAIEYFEKERKLYEKRINETTNEIILSFYKDKLDYINKMLEKLRQEEEWY